MGNLLRMLVLPLNSQNGEFSAPFLFLEKHLPTIFSQLPLG